MEIPARNGLNSPSRHLHAPDCHAAHRQIATIRRCAERASPAADCRSAGHYPVLLDVGARLVAVLRRASCSPHVPLRGRARYSCTERMQTLPSPTADATRLTEPCRTSPTANTPGMLVSNGSGARRNDQDSPDTSRPVRIYPWWSRATAS